MTVRCVSLEQQVCVPASVDSVERYTSMHVPNMLQKAYWTRGTRRGLCASRCGGLALKFMPLLCQTLGNGSTVELSRLRGELDTLNEALRTSVPREDYDLLRESGLEAQESLRRATEESAVSCLADRTTGRNTQCPIPRRIACIPGHKMPHSIFRRGVFLSVY